MDSTLSIKNASGKTFSLLNEKPTNAFKVTKLTTAMTLPIQPKRKYHCTEPGCNKSFTTSGHLARHNRIHTGEKNFHCLHPGCPSRFSRQDNMMQHYRTHLSQKLRRQHLRQQQDRKQPQLYCHSYHNREDSMSLQPLMTTRPRRSITMPSLPYPPNLGSLSNKVVNRPRRALSTSSTCSSSSASSGSRSPPPSHVMMSLYQSNTLPPPMSFTSSPPQVADNYYPRYHYQQHQQHQHQQHQCYHPSSIHYPRHQEHQQRHQQDWTPNSSQKPHSSLLHLANIVSTFG